MANNIDFIPDPEPKQFIPDDPEVKQSSEVLDAPPELPVNFKSDQELIEAPTFIPDDAPLEPLPPPTTIVPEPSADFNVPQEGFSTFDRDKTALSTWQAFLKTRSLLSIPAEKSKEGLTQLADMIPDPESKSTLVNITLGLPKTAGQITAEFAPAFIHPDTLALAGVLKGAGIAAKSSIGQKTISAVAKKIPDNLKRLFTYRFGQPQVYKDAAEQTAINMRVGNEVVGSIGDKLSSFSKAEQRLMAQYLKGEAVSITPEMRAASDAARAEFTRLGKDAVDLGLLDAKTYQANINTYLPRLYRTKELTSRTPQLGTNKPLRANLNRFKRREDIPEEIREGMGEVLEAGYPTTKGLLQLNQAVEKAKMFRQVGQNVDLTARTVEEGIAKEFTQLPKTRALGELSEKWVHPEVARDLNQMIIKRKTVEKLWRKTLGTWKFGKVVLSPSTHARNIMTNSFWLDISGVNHLKQAKALPRMINEIRTNGKLYQLAKENGLIGTELIGADIKPFAEAMKGRQATNMWETFKKGTDVAKRLANKAGKTYQAEEQVFKMIKFEDNLAKGMAPREAALEAEQWIFNYNKIPPITDAIRNSPLGIPFITYISKAIPQLAKAAVNNPLRVYKYVLGFNAMEEVAKKDLGLNSAQMQMVRERGVRLIPFKRKDKKAQTLDVDFLMPWGELAATGKGPLFDFLPQPFTPSGPLFALNNALLANYDPFRKQQVWEDTDTLPQKVTKVTDYLGKAWLPNLTPGVPGLKSPFRGGYHFQELADAFRGEARFPKREAKAIPEALLSTGAGLKTGGLDIEKEFGRFLKRKVSKKDRLLAKTKRLLKHEGVTEKEKTELAKELAPKIEKIFNLKPDIEMLKQGLKVERRADITGDIRTLLDLMHKDIEMKKTQKEPQPSPSLRQTILDLKNQNKKEEIK